jgi:mevalonate kinase
MLNLAMTRYHNVRFGSSSATHAIRLKHVNQRDKEFMKIGNLWKMSHMLLVEITVSENKLNKYCLQFEIMKPRVLPALQSDHPRSLQ